MSLIAVLGWMYSRQSFAQHQVTVMLFFQKAWLLPASKSPNPMIREQKYSTSGTIVPIPKHSISIIRESPLFQNSLSKIYRSAVTAFANGTVPVIVFPKSSIEVGGPSTTAVHVVK
jgi:hypothetical protein